MSHWATNYLPQKSSRDTQLGTSTRRVPPNPRQPLITDAVALPIGAHGQPSIRTGLCNSLHSYSLTTVNTSPTYGLRIPPLLSPLAAQPYPLDLAPNETQNRAGTVLLQPTSASAHTEHGMRLRYAPRIAANGNRHQLPRYS